MLPRSISSSIVPKSQMFTFAILSVPSSLTLNFLGELVMDDLLCAKISNSSSRFLLMQQFVTATSVYFCRHLHLLAQLRLKRNHMNSFSTIANVHLKILNIIPLLTFLDG